MVERQLATLENLAALDAAEAARADSSEQKWKVGKLLPMAYS